jgi:hypothetical protein
MVRKTLTTYIARQAWISGTQANWHCLRGIGGGSVLVVVIGTVA